LAIKTSIGTALPRTSYRAGAQGQRSRKRASRKKRRGKGNGAVAPDLASGEVVDLFEVDAPKRRRVSPRTGNSLLVVPVTAPVRRVRVKAVADADGWVLVLPRGARTVVADAPAVALPAPKPTVIRRPAKVREPVRTDVFVAPPKRGGASHVWHVVAGTRPTLVQRNRRGQVVLDMPYVSNKPAGTPNSFRGVLRTSRRYADVVSAAAPPKSAPAARLVGIEPNPGPLDPIVKYIGYAMYYTGYVAGRLHRLVDSVVSSSPDVGTLVTYGFGVVCSFIRPVAVFLRRAIAFVSAGLRVGVDVLSTLVAPLLSDFEFGWASRPVEMSLRRGTNCFVFISGYYPLVCCLGLASVLCFVPFPRLVGVEPNPGPLPLNLDRHLSYAFRAIRSDSQRPLLGALAVCVVTPIALRFVFRCGLFEACSTVLSAGNEFLFEALPYAMSPTARPMDLCVAPGKASSLRRSLQLAYNPYSCAPVTSSMLSVWLRGLFGRSGYYSGSHFRGLAVESSGVRFSRLENGVVARGYCAHGSEAVTLPFTPPLRADPTLWLGCFARHLVVDPVVHDGPFSDVISPQRYSCGPLHYCGSSCPFRTSGLFQDSQLVRRYGEVLLLLDDGLAHLCWRDQSSSATLPVSLLFDAVNRWALGGKMYQYGIIMTVLSSHQNAVSLVMHILANGFVLRGAFNSSDSDPEFIVSTTETNEVDVGQRIVAVHNPIVASANVVAGRGDDTLAESVYRRVMLPATTAVAEGPIAECIASFSRLVIGGREFSPYTFEQMEACMNKPSQRAELLQLSSTFDIAASSASIFVKTEPVSSSSAARLIVSMRGPQNYSLSRYTLALSDHLKTFSCWCPGKGSQEIQRAVHVLHRESRARGLSMSEGDYAKFDATAGSVAHALWRSTLALAFRFDQAWSSHCDFTMNTSVRVGRHGRTTLGVGTLSGSADTTIRNTLLCWFIPYYAYVRYGGMTPDLAFAHASEGLFSGDDSCLADHIPNPSLVRAAADCGLTLETRIYLSGPTRFLGRFYIDPFVASCNIGDVARFLSSYHLVSVPPGRLVSVAMSQKAFGRMVNDSKTPLIADYCRSVLSACPVFELDEEYFDSYKFSQLTTMGAYTNEHFDSETIMSAISADMGITVEALSDLSDAFRRTSAVQGARYPVLGHLAFKSRPGLIVSGMPLDPPHPPVDLERDLSDVVASFDRVATSVDNVNVALDEDVCAVCQSRYHLTVDCPTCGICHNRGHHTSRCVGVEDASLMGLSPTDASHLIPPPAPRGRGGRSSRGQRRGQRGRGRR